ACARDNVRRLGLTGRVDVVGPGLFPDGRADLIVCNPPWIPARPTSSLEQGVYDPGGAMLRGVLDGLADRLAPGGEGWLILSDLAEHLGLRTRGELLARVEAAGLRVLGRTGVRPRHPRAGDTADPLHAARAAEVTSLWRLTGDHR
ncbi:methyltransferase, partial [Streptomyces sp. TRM76130]|nr:methyltransferase [Streptomyces sp. TRM76130]